VSGLGGLGVWSRRVGCLVSEGWVSGLGGLGVWSRRVGCLVSEGWVSGLGGLGVWSRRVGCLVSEGWVSGLGGLGVWSRRVGCLVSEGWVSGLGGLGVWSRRGGCLVSGGLEASDHLENRSVLVDEQAGGQRRRIRLVGWFEGSGLFQQLLNLRAQCRIVLQQLLDHSPIAVPGHL
jgi:hypothetical protein